MTSELNRILEIPDASTQGSVPIEDAESAPQRAGLTHVQKWARRGKIGGALLGNALGLVVIIGMLSEMGGAIWGIASAIAILIWLVLTLLGWLLGLAIGAISR